MADVIISGACRTARQHRKHRRGAVERLDLGLLIDAQHDGPLWGISVETDDVANLGHEQRVLGQLPRILFVGGSKPNARQTRDTIDWDSP